MSAALLAIAFHPTCSGLDQSHRKSGPSIIMSELMTTLESGVLRIAESSPGPRTIDEAAGNSGMMRASAAPSDPAWQSRWERAIAKIGQPVFKLNSGAGHDAMKMHTIMPQAMLFVRGGNRGISHNPLEIITAEDATLATQAFEALLDEIN
jgi:N-carbamoyl-L-amino-acid hydrolase